MRVGIVGLLHESNTFIDSMTSMRHFQQDLLLTGPEIRERMQGAKHEIGGFFHALEAAGIEAVPLFLARAYPSGVIDSRTFDTLVSQMLDAVEDAGTVDGILAAPHGATVAENHRDADGHWLGEIRTSLGTGRPLVATIDPHANVSAKMVESTDALIAYRTNPHLDQFETGKRAAELMAATLQRKITPTQSASFPPLAINIRSQTTSEPPISRLIADAESICRGPGVLSHNVVLGFPYADVAEMGSSAIVVTDNDSIGAQRLADEVAERMWLMRSEFEPPWVGVDAAVAMLSESPQRTLSRRTLLLDMGDNVGGGSPADGTTLCRALQEKSLGPSLVALCDPESVRHAEQAGVGQAVTLTMGGKTDRRHGDPLVARCTVISLHDGRFREMEARHGGFQEFDQGPTAVVRTDRDLTVLLTSLRVPPFSLQQLYASGIDPTSFRVLIAKGVIAPLAAYGPICDRVIHVNTPGVTCADMKQLRYENRRRPMFPFEDTVAETRVGAN